MMNLIRFSKISFKDLVSLPNYYIHEIYKSYVEDYKLRLKKEEQERKEREAKEREEKRLNNIRGQQDSNEVANLRQLLASQGLTNDRDLEDFVEELEDGI